MPSKKQPPKLPGRSLSLCLTYEFHCDSHRVFNPGTRLFLQVLSVSGLPPLAAQQRKGWYLPRQAALLQVPP